MVVPVFVLLVSARVMVAESNHNLSTDFKIAIKLVAEVNVYYVPGSGSRGE
jgi:hypothetical protein